MKANHDWKLIHEPHSLTAANGAFDTGCAVHGPSMFGVIRVPED